MSHSAHGTGHDRWTEEAAAYALGALEGAERRQFEEHLAACEECKRELATMRGAVEALPAAAPLHAAPPELKARVMDAVRAEAQTGAATRSKQGARRKGLASIRPRWAISAVAAAAAAAAVAIALVSGGGSSVHTYTGVVSAPGASALVRQSGSATQLEVKRLPAPPSGRIYEVWLKRAGQAPTPASALFSTSTGSVALPANLHGIQSVLVTAEPKPSGSRKPTRTPIIVVQLA